MSTTLIGGLFGFLAALLFEVLNIYKLHHPAPVPPGKASSDEVQSDSSAASASPVADEPIPYVWLDVLRSSIRPVLTYAIVLSFLVMKFWAFEHAILHDAQSPIEVLPVVWDAAAAELLGLIVGFWFGSRVMTTGKKKK